MPNTGLPNTNNEVADTCHPCGVARRDVVPEVPEVPDVVPGTGREAVIGR